MSAISKKKMIDFVIKLRKKLRSIEDNARFCESHNFKLEAMSIRNQAELMQTIIHETEDEFDLGFVWDESLDN